MRPSDPFIYMARQRQAIRFEMFEPKGAAKQVGRFEIHGAFAIAHHRCPVQGMIKRERANASPAQLNPCVRIGDIDGLFISYGITFGITDRSNPITLTGRS